MCGVCGTWTGHPDESLRLAQLLRGDLIHRGPDANTEFNWPDSGLSLGHTRLSIIDLSSSTQPMHCSCGRHTISFNGEIFNYRDLRTLVDYPFKTDGDSETLLALLCQLGIESLRFVRGQFAFALWDAVAEELTLAVDAHGILPMYVYDADDLLAFSSSAASLSATLDKCELDEDSIPYLLTQRSITAPATVYRDIERIGPGEYWTFTSYSRRRNRWIESFAQRSLNADKHGDLVELLQQAAARAVTADVEVGVFLSGGLDSAVVAALAQRQLPYKLKAFTAAWPGHQKENELSAAARTARVLGLDHVVVDMDARLWWDSLRKGSTFRDAPMGEPADAVFYALAERARQDVRVVLTGEGADELFCGYPKYRAEFFAQYSVPRGLAHLALKVPGLVTSARFSRLLEAVAMPNPTARFAHYFATTWNELSPPAASSRNTDKGLSWLQELRVWDLEEWLPAALLDRADRMAMAHSLEVRPIFLDKDVVDFALSLNARDLISVRGTKRALRKAARRILPGSLTHTRKRGFPLPLTDWIRTDLQDEFRLILERDLPAIDRYVNKPERLRLLEQHIRGDADNTLRLFTLVSLAVWMETLV